MSKTQWDTTRLIGRWREPRHKGVLFGENVKQSTATSLGCGDKITVYLAVEEDGSISDAKFSALSGVRCAVIADLLIDEIFENNLLVEDVLSMNTKSFVESIGMSVPPTKWRSVGLPLKALKQALEG